MKYIMICSDQYPERKKLSIESLNRFGITDVIFSEAVFVDSFPDDFNDRRYIGQKSRKNLGTVGAYLAHRNAIKLSMEYDDHCMILEDDIVVSSEFNVYVEQLVEILDSESPDVIQLKCNKKFKTDDFSLIRKPTKFTGVQGYIVHKDNKSRVLEISQKYYGAIDKIFLKSEINLFQLTKWLVWSNLKHKSIIQTRAKEVIKSQKDDIYKEINRRFDGLSRHPNCLSMIENDNYRIFDLPKDISSVIDIGSCLGEVSFSCKFLFPTAKIVAVEATSTTFKFLSHNLKGTGIHIENSGIWHSDGEDLFIEKISKRNIGQNKTRTDNNSKSCETCKSKTIRTLIEDYNIDLSKKVFLKLDCEGCEVSILNDIDLCKSMFQISMELHNLYENYEMFSEFLNKLSDTHDIIYGRLKKRRIPIEIVLRRKQ